MTIKLFPEQLKGVELAKDKDCFALFMGAGTGKTYTALEIINQWESTNILLVSPKSVILEWQNSIKTYGNEQNFTIITPQKYSRNIKEYSGFDTVILDEAHGMKDPKSKIHKGIIRLDVRKRLILTGTPTDGKVHELLSISNLLSMDIIGNYWNLKRRDFVLDDYEEILYARPGVYERYIEFMSPYMYTLTKLSSLELPKLELEHHMLDMLPKQREIYDLMNNYTYINSKGKTKSVHGSAVLVGKLRSICSGFYKDELDSIRKFTSCKENYIRKLLTDKTIVFINFTHEENTLKRICEEENLTYKVLTGSTNNTPEYITEIKKFDYNVLIVNYKSGGVGLNLIASKHIILYALPLSYIEYDQAIKRIYRIGQQEETKVDILVCKNSYESKLIGKLESKSKILLKIFNK